jgi:carbamoyltransferase
MNILGISAFYHDSAASLIIDGEILAAAQEERFTRKKHDPRFPGEAIEYCLKEGRITAKDLDATYPPGHKKRNRL